LEEHALKLSLSKKNVAPTPTWKVDPKKTSLKPKSELALVGNEEAKSNKLLVKNLAFETTEPEIKELFKTYGALKKVRMPKKTNSKVHRGFGFVEFVNAEEAANAFTHLQHSHLYGRKIVIEWAKPEDSTISPQQAPTIVAPPTKRVKV
jgi:multiple RNA-binding domain-containing protein 1